MAFTRRRVRITSWRSHPPARTSHTLVRGWLEETWLVSVEAEDDGSQDGEECVVLNLEECRFRFENFDLRSEPNSAEKMVENTVEEGGDPRELR